jgi:hypothetical protein
MLAKELALVDLNSKKDGLACVNPKMLNTPSRIFKPRSNYGPKRP